MTSLAFIKRWFAWLLVFIAGSGILNLIIDPYDMFGTPRIAHFNATKPTSGRKVRIAKPYAVLRRKPQVIIAGNSRPEMGINPANSCFSAYRNRIYNLAVPGSSVYMQVRFIQNALSTNSQKLVLYGVDFTDFLMRPLSDAAKSLWPPPRQHFEERLRVTANGDRNRGYFWRYGKDHLQALFSMDALTDSVITIALQGREEHTTRTERGFNPAKSFYTEIIRTEGQWVLFEQKLKQLAVRLKPARYTLYRQGTQWSAKFEAVEHLIRATQREHVRLVLFINPYHAEYIEAIYRSGYGKMFEQWKRTMAKLAMRYDIELFDFSGYTPYATEIPSPPGEKSHMLHWFWEPAHYREQLGALMLERMLGDRCAEHLGVNPDFGRLLRSASIDKDIALSKAGRKSFLRKNPAVIRHLNSLFRPTGTKSAEAASQ